MIADKTAANGDDSSSMRDMVLHLMGTKFQDSGFTFSAFLDLRQSLQGVDAVGSSDGKEGQQAEFPPPSEAQQSGCPCQHCCSLPPEENPSSGPAERQCEFIPPTPSPLCETAIFVTARRFMICQEFPPKMFPPLSSLLTGHFRIILGNFGVLLIYFGEPGQPIYCHGLHNAGRNEEREAWKLIETIEAMKTQVIDPILNDERFRVVWTLFRAVEGVLDLGCIQNFAELANVMIALATVSEPHPHQPWMGPVTCLVLLLTGFFCLPSTSALSQTSSWLAVCSVRLRIAALMPMRAHHRRSSPAVTNDAPSRRYAPADT